MKSFTFSRRAAAFGLFSNKVENPNTDQRHKVLKLPVRWSIKRGELDMIVPANEISLSDFLLGTNKRKPQIQTTVLAKIPVARTPTVNFTVYDSPADKRKVLTFENALVLSPAIVIDPTDHSLWLKAILKIEPGKNLQRIADNIESQTLDFECEESQTELFGADGEPADTEGGEQTELMEDPDDANDDD